jgi:uncharacterized membrane protein
MTAAETLEYAQTSVDQLERGIGFVQDRLAQAEGLASRVDEIAVTAGDVATKARRVSKYALIVTGVVILGAAVYFAARKCPIRRPAEEPDETTTEEATD